MDEDIDRKRALAKVDPSLLKDRAAFLKKAISNPVAEKRKKEHLSTSNKHVKKIKPSSSSSIRPGSNDASSASASFNYKTAQATSHLKFSILAKIVKHMKERHKIGDTFPLTLEEILEETNQMDISPRISAWLETEALKNNPKIDQVDGNKFVFKPVFQIRDRKGLLKLLKNHDMKGLGGVLQDDIEESVPNAHRAIEILKDNILFVTRPTDKKKILFFNDKGLKFPLDEEFQKLWRSVSVEGMDERKMEEYLDKHGINTMQDLTSKKLVQAPKRRKTVAKRAKNFKSQNEHLNDLLEDYSTVGISQTKT